MTVFPMAGVQSVAERATFARFSLQKPRQVLNGANRAFCNDVKCRGGFCLQLLIFQFRAESVCETGGTAGKVGKAAKNNEDCSRKKKLHRKKKTEG